MKGWKEIGQEHLCTLSDRPEMREPLTRLVASSGSKGQAAPCVLKGLLARSETAGSIPCWAEGRARSLTALVTLTVDKKQSIYMNYGLENYFQK